MVGDMRVTHWHSEVWGKSTEMEAFGEGSRVAGEVVEKKIWKNNRHKKKRGIAVAGSQKKTLK